MTVRPRRGGRWGLALLLAVGVPWAALEAQETPGEDFGRWESSLQRCRIVSAYRQSPQPPPATCHLVRLDQQMEGLLTVRFLQPGGNGSFLDRQLVFAGVLAEGSRGMQCLRSRCEPRWPLRLRVSAVGQAGFGDAMAAMGVTSAQLASGHCLLDDRAFRCEATGAQGRLWQAEATP